MGKDYKKTSHDFKRVRTTKRVPRLKVRKLKQDETKLQKRSLRYVVSIDPFILEGVFGFEVVSLDRIHSVIFRAPNSF